MMTCLVKLNQDARHLKTGQNIEPEPKSGKQIQGLLGLKQRKTFPNNYLKPLLRSDWIEMTVPDKPRSRLQKYQLTPAELEIQQSLLGGYSFLLRGSSQPVIDCASQAHIRHFPSYDLF